MILVNDGGFTFRRIDVTPVAPDTAGKAFWATVLDWELDGDPNHIVLAQSYDPQTNLLVTIGGTSGQTAPSPG